MHLALVTAPAVEPLTVAEARAQQNIGAAVPDEVVAAWIKGERQKLDGANGLLGRALITQTWDMVLDGFPCAWRKPFGGHRFGNGRPRYHQEEIRIPLPPLQSIGSIKYLDGNGDEQTVDPATYRIIRGEPAYLVPTSSSAWPGGALDHGSVTVRFTCGYGDDGEDVPEPIRQAISDCVKVRQSMAASDPLVRSETVDGVGSTAFNAPAYLAQGAAPHMDAILQQFRVGGGIS